MADPTAEHGAYAIAVLLLSLGGLLTLTIALAVVGIPMMLIGAVIAYKTYRTEFDDADESSEAAA